ncbi:TPA: phage portal protein [Salmonella enterica subsp. houtenae]|nr:phage portal protein [Salmonella enterica]HAU3048641.1 phage portal protein [Salmonella enterica subsp. houtenae]
MPHTSGEWARRKLRIEFEPWQKFALGVPFGWVRKDTGFRRFTEIYIEVPRKNGKSAIAAAVGNYMFCADGEYAAEVYCGATTEKQAWKVFAPALAMVKKLPALRQKFCIKPWAKKMTRPDGSLFAPIIGDPGDGDSPSCAIIDEYHEHDTDALYTTMTTGMGAREQPITLIITTAGFDIASPCYEKRTQVVEILERIREGGENEAIFGIIYTLDDDDDWTQPEALIKANPNYNISVKEGFLKAKQLLAMSTPGQTNKILTKHFNKWVSSKAAYYNLQKWMPLHVMRRTGKKVETARDHPAFYLVHDEPNSWQTSYKWRELKQRHILGWGNGYTRVLRHRRTGEVTGLEACMPWETTLLNTGGRYTYGVYNEEGSFAINPDDMIHVRALGNDQKMGLSPVLQHAETIGMGMSGQKYTESFFSGNARPAGIVSVKGELNDGAWKRLKEMWQKATAMLRSQENRTMLLPAELDYKALTVSPVDAQLIDMMKLNRSMIAGIFNVPAHMINDLEKATFSNISEQAIQFVRYTMMPWVTNWEQELNRRLFTRAEREAGYYVRFNLAGLLRGTAKERAEFYHFAITDGWMSRNEARAFEDMNPIDGLDEMLVSVNASRPAKSTTQENTQDE